MSSSQKEPMIVRWKDNIVEIGAGRPVVIQSMTNTDTADVESSTKQVLELALAGSELVRLTVNTPAAAKAIPEIRRRLDETGCFVPLVGDFHYNGHKLLTEYRECAEALSKYRINPGNVGKGDKQEENFRTMVELAKKYDKPVRIGVNWGSLDQDLLACMMSENQKLEKPLDAKEVLREALVRSAVENADRAVELGMKPSQVAISAKVSGVKDLIAVYRELKARCAYPLHPDRRPMHHRGHVSVHRCPRTSSNQMPHGDVGILLRFHHTRLHMHDSSDCHPADIPSVPLPIHCTFRACHCCYTCRIPMPSSVPLHYILQNPRCSARSSQPV